MIAIDQIVKIWIRSAIPIHGSLNGLPWPGVFELTLTYNKGVAFGMFQGFGIFLAPIAVAIAVGCGIYSWRHPQESAWSHSAMSLLASGAVGNLYDRVVEGRVTDMFWFRLIDFPVFNVADACITVATCLLILVWWLDGNKAKAAAKQMGEPSDSPESF